MAAPARCPPLFSYKYRGGPRQKKHKKKTRERGKRREGRAKRGEKREKGEHRRKQKKEQQRRKQKKYRGERERRKTAGHREPPAPPPPPLPHQLLPASTPFQVTFSTVIFFCFGFGFICMQNVYVLQQMKIN